ncbi:flagellar hook-length control protein FliK [Roseovarius sp. LXJ103]|uniref:flagellar hook-length control protein FliK n=1 Tax=Roseovarius carneus TaxID=2853164 RepID=UPI0015E8126B|nr:flagellar hook-length control protein FliK [Roseovarius carneus]MBZ8117525.1 flagellar hook-length control protein FliK [Roseovarius carneus]
MFGSVNVPTHAGALPDAQSARAVSGPPERGKGDGSFAAIFGRAEATPDNVVDAEDATADADPEQVSDAPMEDGALALDEEEEGPEIEASVPDELHEATMSQRPSDLERKVGRDAGAAEMSAISVSSMSLPTSDTPLSGEQVRVTGAVPALKGAMINVAAAGGAPLAASNAQGSEATDALVVDAKRNVGAPILPQIIAAAPAQTGAQTQPNLTDLARSEARAALASATPESGAVHRGAAEADTMPLRVTQGAPLPLSGSAAAAAQPETRFSYPIDMTMRVGAAQPEVAVAAASPAPAPAQKPSFSLSAAMIAAPAGADTPERGVGLEALSGATELRSTAPAADLRPGAPSPSTQAETARQVAVQIADAVRSGEKPIELTLNPAELGRVRLALAPGDGVMMVTVLADRPETLDLMRRHIDMLAQELRAIGYGSTAFSFGQDSGGSKAGGFAPGDSTSDTQTTANDALETPPPEAPLATMDRLDIRL